MKTGTIVSVSIQQILDCSTADNGCLGGWPPDTLRTFVSRNFTFIPEALNPYIALQLPCQLTASPTHYQITGTYPDSEFLRTELDLLRLVVLYGSVSVAIKASADFQSYSNGIFDEPACNLGGCSDVDHGVTIVGYNLTAPIPYWYSSTMFI
jgi:hypothetical protein